MLSDQKKAMALFSQGKLSEARKMAGEALKKNPGHPDILHFLGRLDLQDGKLPRAVGRLKRAVDLAPLSGEYHLSLAEACRRSKDLLRAEWECKLAMRFGAESVEALNILGLVHRDQGKYPEAVQVLSQAIREKAPHLEAMNNLATVFIRLGEYALAENYLNLVVKAEPCSGRAWNNLGLALRGQHRLPEAKEALLKGGDYIPARFNLGHILLLEDNLREGLPLYENRKILLGLGKVLKKPEWDGTPRPQSALLVVAEQGLGDMILVSRFFPLLTRYFGKVFIQTPAPLLRLMRRIDTDAMFISEGEKVEFDFWCPMMSLPLRLGIDSVGKIPQTPWFNLPDAGQSGSCRADSYQTDSYQADPRQAGRSLRIGLNWAGNPSYHYDRVRSAHLKDLEMLLRVKGAKWYSLHKGCREDEAEPYGLERPLKDAHDFLDTALFIRSLDVVISTETAIPNLSAALGILTCVLTAPDYDWRWSSWYNSAVLCPQDRQGNWFGAIGKAFEIIRRKLEPCSP